MQKAQKQKEDAVRGMLRKRGFKATGARLRILGIVRREKNPISAQELIAAIGSAIDQATVYRTLKSLKHSGIIRQVDLRHNHAHYELAGAAEHHHLICLRCGRIEDVHDCSGEEMEKTILRHSKHFADVRQHALEFYGVCKACARKSELSAVGPHKDAPL